MISYTNVAARGRSPVVQERPVQRGQLKAEMALDPGHVLLGPVLLDLVGPLVSMTKQELAQLVSCPGLILPRILSRSNQVAAR
jgi:hypothetical protein